MFDKEKIMQKIKCMPSEYPQALATQFPHILQKIVELWCSPEGEDYFTDLLQPNGRGGGRMDRDGFPVNAWQEITKLRQLSKKPRMKAG